MSAARRTVISNGITGLARAYSIDHNALRRPERVDHFVCTIVMQAPMHVHMNSIAGTVN